MKLKLILVARLLTLSLVPAFAEQVGPWNLDALKSKVPAMKWLRQDQPVHSLTYAGEKYQGHPTEVFAFYASPITLGEAKAGREVSRRGAHSRRRRHGVRGVGASLGEARLRGHRDGFVRLPPA